MSPAPVGKFSAVITLLITAISVFAQRAVVHEKDIVKAIVDQFDKSDLVGLGELHGSQADQDLRFQIIHNKAFARKVRIIAVEGLNAFDQEDLDRYIRGEDVPLEQVQKVWRNSTGIFSSGPVIRTTYQQFLGEVRSVNRGLPDRMKLRVIAADPPLDWAKVQSTADFRAVLSKRVVFGVDVIEREALQKGQKASWSSPVRGLPATCNIGPQTGWFLGRRPSVQGLTAIIPAVYMSSLRCAAANSG